LWLQKNKKAVKNDGFFSQVQGIRKGAFQSNTVTKWVWDWDKPLHEWKEHALTGAILSDTSVDRDGIITWVFEEDSFAPVAKLKGEKKYSIITDHLGTPAQMYNQEGKLCWQGALDSYGRMRMEKGETGSCPFRYQGQYEDKEIGLYYNRFRYYSPEEGMYLSQDPIRLEGGNKLYGYVDDPNAWVDILGLAGTGGAYMFGFENGKMYIGKGETGRMGDSIAARTKQVGNSPLIGKAHVSTGGNNELGKMVEYKAMVDAGFTPGKAGVPSDYLNSHLSGKSAWNNPKNKHLQGKATELADKLRADYDADVKARAKTGC
jgi:RHS repeat-associated protein